ncbi:polysaccharide deacetylase family protein [Autumnicola musiva]|uniref:Polysaccharide deacetylase family protein n=1 Tax=Autumnicola musiva TaxID=3075589 RepID=A0ABU3D7H1_9FLAO|nr:polysaccharide deacetylase family protein [Zunongwangia sp. F117]MDT0677462.1 polysaccharide deacetylase family protein [Zunongwangia sp. F117]
MKYLNSHFHVISLEDLKKHLFENKKLPKKSVLITFDDGDISVYENALPVLAEFKMPSVSFVITSLIGSSNTFWCRWVEKAIQREGKSYAEARKKVNHLKKVPNSERIAYLKSLPEIKSRQLSPEEIYEMEKKGISTGNHTHTHPMVDNCKKEEIKEELKNAKMRFRKLGLEGYDVFAYPNGNWDMDTEEVLKKEGIKMAFLFDHQVNKEQINPLRISRLMVDTYNDLNEFKVKVSGLHSKILKFNTRFK